MQILSGPVLQRVPLCMMTSMHYYQSFRRYCITTIFRSPLTSPSPSPDPFASLLLLQFKLARGQILFSTGSTLRRHLLFLVDGRVCVSPSSTSSDGDSNESVDLGIGAVFGGKSFVTGHPHINTIRCLTPCQFARVSYQDFDDKPEPVLIEVSLIRLHSISICERDLVFY